MLSTLLDPCFYNKVIIYFNRENKKIKLKETSLYWWIEIIHILIITRKLHGFGAKYNLKQKYITLSPSYNLEIEKYKEKHNLLTLDLSSEARLED